MEQHQKKDTSSVRSSIKKKPIEKQPLVQLLTNKNSRKMAKTEKQMAGSVVLVCALAVVLVIVVKMFA